MVGDDSLKDPPVPIPNTEVKLQDADGTAGATLWESRSSPTNPLPPPLSTTAPGAASLVRAIQGASIGDARCRSRTAPHGAPFAVRGQGPHRAWSEETSLSWMAEGMGACRIPCGEACRHPIRDTGRHLLVSPISSSPPSRRSRSVRRRSRRGMLGGQRRSPGRLAWPVARGATRARGGRGSGPGPPGSRALRGS